MKIRVQIVTDNEKPLRTRGFITPSVSYWIAITIYSKLIELLTGCEPDKDEVEL